MKAYIPGLLCLLLAGCASEPAAKREAAAPEVKKEEPKAEVKAPEAKKVETPKPEVKKAEKKEEKKTEAPNLAGVFKVKFETSKGPFVMEVHRDWAPLGVDRFVALVKSGYFNQARFFRVVPNFIIQFGLAASPAVTKKWDKAIQDDPVTQTNRVGSVTFATAGKNTRTTQLFINLRSNQMLDSQGFAPFAQVIEGMDVVEKLYPGYGESPDQQAITMRGNSYIEASFPKLDFIKSATIQ
ncbi:MAG: peptidylprolyl isomerase [Bryobacteraceae bacterium]